MTGAVTASLWGPEDRALMLALQVYRSTLCPRCGTPKEKAWHLDNGQWYEIQAEFVCHPCTVHRNAGEDGPPVKYLRVVDTRNYDTDPLHGHYTDHAAPGTHALPPPPASPTPREEALA